MQCGMQETGAAEIELNAIPGPVLQLLVSYMYGALAEVPGRQLLPLFLAADAHQVILCLPWHLSA